MSSPVWDLERTRPVVDEWDAAVRAAVPAYARLVPEAEARGSVLRPPATEAEIVAAEARLGVSFPPSYRSFLKISNGADAGNLASAGQMCRLHEIERNELRSTEELGQDDEIVRWLASMLLQNFGDPVDFHRPPLPATAARADGGDGDPDGALARILAARAAALTVPARRLAELASEGALGKPLDDVCTSLLHMHANRLLGPEPPSEQHVLGLALRTREGLARTQVDRGRRP